MIQNTIKQDNVSLVLVTVTHFTLSYDKLTSSLPKYCCTCIAIREIPDHATFREKEHTLGWLDKLVFFLSLSL